MAKNFALFLAKKLHLSFSPLDWRWVHTFRGQKRCTLRNSSQFYGQAAVTYRFPSDHRSQAPSSGVSTWMGDHPGTPRAVGNTWCTRHMAKPRPQVGRVCWSHHKNTPQFTTTKCDWSLDLSKKKKKKKNSSFSFCQMAWHGIEATKQTIEFPAAPSFFSSKNWIKLIPKTIGNRKKRLCVRLLSRDKHHLRKSADRKAQIR